MPGAGAGGKGQLGRGSQAGSSTPVLAAPGNRFKQVSAGGEHTCAIHEDGDLLCWGAFLAWGVVGL